MAARVMGIDPGISATGYGVLEPARPRPRLVACGTIRPPAGGDLGRRLLAIHDGLSAVVERWAPAEAAVENIFLARNVRSTVMLGHARGAAILAAARSGLGIFEYTPLEIKQAVVGYGKAQKRQVQMMLPGLVDGGPPPDSADAADAIAAALCHLGLAGSAMARQIRSAGAGKGRG